MVLTEASSYGSLIFLVVLFIGGSTFFYVYIGVQAALSKATTYKVALNWKVLAIRVFLNAFGGLLICMT